MRRVAGLLLLVIVLAGCGQDNPPEGMNAKFEKLDYQISVRETVAAPSDPSIARLTREYAALVRHYAPQLGPAEAKRRLTQEADEVAQYCLACAATLYDAAKKY
jgi:hypothetical protein